MKLNLNVFASKPKQGLFSSPSYHKKVNGSYRRRGIFTSLGVAFLLVFSANAFTVFDNTALSTRSVFAAGAACEPTKIAEGTEPVSNIVMPVFVAEAVPAARLTGPATDNTEEVLTYDRAVELAIKNSIELKNAREGVLQAEEMREMLANLRRISGFTPVGPGYDQADAVARELLMKFTAADTGLRMAARQIEILEEMIAFQVRCAYDGVLQNSAALEKIDRSLAFTAKKLIQIETKTRLGVESSFNRENARLGYAAEKEQREKLARQLDEAYVDLNKLIGLEPGARPRLQEHDPLAWQERETDQQPRQEGKSGQSPQQKAEPDKANQLEKDQEKEVDARLEGESNPLPGVDETGLERHLAIVLHDHPYLWLQEQQVAQAERELSLYTYNVGMPPYKAVKSSVQQERNELYIMKEDVSKDVRSLYYQLQGLESQYKALEKNLALAENGLRAVQVRHRLGMAVPLEVEEAELAVLEIESGMQDLARAYGQLRMLYEKPWVMPVAAGSQPK